MLKVASKSPTVFMDLKDYWLPKIPLLNVTQVSPHSHALFSKFDFLHSQHFHLGMGIK